MRFLSALVVCVLCLMAAKAEAACAIQPPLTASPTQAPKLDIFTNDRVVITGGCIDGTPIGGNTPSTGAFTNLSVSGIVTTTFAGVGDAVVSQISLTAGSTAFSNLTGTPSTGQT